MANRRLQSGNRRMDMGHGDRSRNFGRSNVSPWQGVGPSANLPNLLPLGGGPTEATLALASNIINLLQPRQAAVPSLLDMPIRRDFGPAVGRYDRGFVPNRMNNQGNFRRSGNYNRAGERINTNRKPYRPNDGQRQQNKSSPKKDADSKAKPVKESTNSHQEKEAETALSAEKKEDDVKKEAPKTRFDDVNPQLLRCHICNKSMWDGRSFENHLSGRAHAIMMQKTAESYALTADTMRQELKIREMKRTRKSGQQAPRDFFCAMCDMYAADGAIHRTTVGHRRLKKYLHPNCTCCHKEMPTRIELDEHRLTAEHMKNFQERQEVVVKPKPEVMVISTLSMEQSYVRDVRLRTQRDAIAAASAHKDADNEEQTQEQNDEGEEMEQDSTEVKEKMPDKENTILDYKEGDDLTHITSEMFPAYSTERGVGKSFLAEFRCVQCRLCRKMLDSEETAEVHLRTWRHHQLFTRLLADKSGGGAVKQEKQQEETEAEALMEAESCKRTLETEESGNWKRRKVTPDGDDGDDSPERDAADEPPNGHADNTDVAIKTEPQPQSEDGGNVEGDGDNVETDGDNLEADGDNVEGDGDNVEGDGDNLKEDGANLEGDGDHSMPPADELEDWEQSLDGSKDDEPAKGEKRVEPEAKKISVSSPGAGSGRGSPAGGRGTPRGRGPRGRRRGRRGGYY